MPVPMQLPTNASRTLAAHGFRRTMSRERERSVSALRNTSVLMSLVGGAQPAVRRVCEAASKPADPPGRGKAAACSRFQRFKSG
jgi:hypothetical protein